MLGEQSQVRTQLLVRTLNVLSEDHRLNVYININIGNIILYLLSFSISHMLSLLIKLPVDVGGEQRFMFVIN